MALFYDSMFFGCARWCVRGVVSLSPRSICLLSPASSIGIKLFFLNDMKQKQIFLGGMIDSLSSLTPFKPFYGQKERENGLSLLYGGHNSNREAWALAFFWWAITLTWRHLHTFACTGLLCCCIFATAAFFSSCVSLFNVAVGSHISFISVNLSKARHHTAHICIFARAPTWL